MASQPMTVRRPIRELEIVHIPSVRAGLGRRCGPLDTATERLHRVAAALGPQTKRSLLVAATICAPLPPAADHRPAHPFETYTGRLKATASGVPLIDGHLRVRHDKENRS